MKDFRCANCNKLLGKIEGRAEIKCPKCKRLNRGITLKDWMEDNLKNNHPGVRIPISKNGIIV